MSDSFFNARNAYDEQAQAAGWSSGICESLLEASARRMIKLEGPIQTAQRLQRLADICAGAYVLPIEHWKTTPVAPAPAAPAKRSRFDRAWSTVVSNPAAVFWTGFFLGLWFGGY